MRLFILLMSVLQLSWGQVNFQPSWIVGFNPIQPIDDFILAPNDIIFDSSKGAVMPRMYRSPIFFQNARPQEFNLAGFNQLHISGSAQYSWLELKELLNHIHKRHKIPFNKIYIIDLREEPHAFINGSAVSWFYGPLHVQQNRASQEIIDSELKRINQVRAFPMVFINSIQKSERGVPSAKKTEIYPVEVVMREQEAVKSFGAHYIRLPVTDHFRPEERDIDDFIAMVKGLPVGVWLHFKCRGGKGRTTTFMTLYDIIQNPKVSLEHILARQKALGGTDLSHNKISVGKEWKYRLAQDRINIIRVFFEYRHASDGWDHMKFSDWVKKHAKYLGYLGDQFEVE